MMDRHSTRTHERRPFMRPLARPLIALLGCAMLVTVLPACQRSLFANEPSRTPFDSYDRQRGQEATSYVWDPFMQRRPNLRQRLLPKD